MNKLTPEQESALFARFKDNQDLEARNELIEQYLYIAQIAAKKFIGRGVDYEDLYQVASVALVNAIERFDPDRGIKFISFASPSIIGEIKNYFRDKTRMMHISRRDSEQLYRLQEIRQTLENPTPKQLAEALEVSEERVLELLELQRAVAVGSLDQAAGDEEDSQVSDFVGEEEQGFSNIEQKDFLRYSLSKLDDREKKVIYERFWKKRSQKEVAEILGVSQMYVSRLEKKILTRMRELYQED